VQDASSRGWQGRRQVTDGPPTFLVRGQDGRLRVCSYNPAALLGAPVDSKTADRKYRQIGWDEDADEAGRAPFKPLSREEARAVAAKDSHAVNPWRVIAVQAAVGLGVALVAGFATGRVEVFWSALYGAGVVVVPGALMARGMTSPLSSVSPIGSAVSFMLWEGVKIGVSVVLLILAARIVQPLSWPALLAGLVVCIKVYWLALSWRRRV
jgi:ATP synthase protein I